jgi:hypothetical protein
MLNWLTSWIYRYRIWKMSRSIPQDMLTMDIDEFAKLLKSKRPEDMKLLARLLSSKAKVKI